MNKKIYIIIITVLLAILTVSTFFIIRYHINSAKQNDLYVNLAEQVNVSEEVITVENDMEETEENGMLESYEELYRQNPDIVGWIKIEGTNINYPVMQSVDEANFYLKHDFNREYSSYGCPYVQKNCNVTTPPDNIVIYGHHMSNGSMFADLDKYKSKSFWEEHKTITFDTLTQHNEYEIVAVFKTVVYTEDCFKYYDFINAENETEFDEYIAKCKKLALYDTGVSAGYGDKLITLSTCEYSQTNGRIVVVAKLMK